MKYIAGIDEVGRGPLAGPVMVGVVVCSEKTYTILKRNKHLPPIGKDSKKLSEKDREKYVKVLKNLKISLRQKNFLDFSVSHISNKTIDTKGLSYAIRKAMEQGIKKLKLDPKKCRVLLDGGLHAPKEFVHQKTIIKGDEKEKIIAWASIVAKVSRDSVMKKLSKKYPHYGFEIHKGYGTLSHRQAIKKYGLSPLHRKSFCH